jgi:COP9 signalosome complex subunit 7
MNNEIMEQLVLLAKGQKGRALEALIQKALSSKKTFVFGELLALPSVRHLDEGPDGPYTKSLRTLELFAYGKYEDYLANRNDYIDLNEEQCYKLKQLSIIGMASQSRILNYKDLAKNLDTKSTRELEDIIIDTIYMGLLKARLNQRDGEVRVKDYMGRDVPPADVAKLPARLEHIQSKISDLIRVFKSSGAVLTEQRVRDKDLNEKLTLKISDVKSQVRSETQSSIGSMKSGMMGLGGAVSNKYRK